MALTTVKDIADYNLSKSEMLLALETDAYELFPGAKVAQKIGESGTCLVGGTFEFVNARGDAFTFTIVGGTPNYDDAEVRERGAATFAAFVVLLAQDFAKNYAFSELYDFTTDATYLYITAKNKGSEYGLVSDSVLTDTGCALTTHGIAIYDAVFAENYKMQADVWMESENNLGDFTKIGSQELTPVDNICQFDLQQIVNANLRYDAPSYSATTPTECKNVLKRFYVRYHEKYGDPIVSKQVYTSDVIRALKAGVNTLQLSETEVYEQHYRKGHFLTRQPLTKKVSEIQKEYLYYTPNVDSDAHGVKMRTTVYFLDNSKPAVVTDSAALSMVEHKLYYIPVGFNQLGLEATHNFAEVKKWTVEFREGDTLNELSDVFTFIADHDRYKDEKYFLFANGDGGFDTFRATGEQVRDEEVQSETVYNANKLYYKKNALKTDQLKQATGFITLEQSKWLTDLLLSEEVYEITNGQLVPIVITSSRKPTEATQRTVHSFSFDYYYAFTDAVSYKPQL